ncbi:Transcriptional regulator GlxA family, contains an amidase domain and an AraC-type DNA-binding HTH domain [Pseudomonas flavescens]|uniref:Transcriptional regulator GlxA family, contains an amidase domain and an AraC-type DNA-binding HTH domain n=1 Tax=Phytopseudomonas flavescens TaxID=29435 RepID=A0A1G8F0P2_9GAMM|nr:helix-turn-helix domain-containing protein [Pseudomonas flavescens]SDH75647.1 Transcriptional regulator GlxA family, contains an amidase domain and an AraC-type DNA-binding HTH domain [Pseudomonas flavescens]
MSGRCLEIGLLLYPGVQLAAVYGLGDLFAVANRLAGGQQRQGLAQLRVSHWQVDEQDEVRRVFDSHGQDEDRLRVVILPPCLDSTSRAGLASAYRLWLRHQHRAGVTLASVCAGAFPLAEAGLLDGRSVTTHWALADELAARFPAVKVLPERMIVEDADLITAGGLMAWTDLGLALVARLLGPTIAAETARFLVVDLNRASQRHFSSFVPSLDHGDSAVLSVQHWLQGAAMLDATLPGMAARAGLGERTFLRRFRSATGMKPTEYCQQLRVTKARELLELTRYSVEQVAGQVGYQDSGAFRKVFTRLVGLAPGDYRRRFGGSRRGLGCPPAAPVIWSSRCEDASSGGNASITGLLHSPESF